MATAALNLPAWDNEEALRIGIAEDPTTPRTETIVADGFDTTITFLCPWNRRFAAYNYIWEHTAPIIGAKSMLFNGTEPVNLMMFRDSVIDREQPLLLDNEVDMWKLFWKPMATQIQIAAFSEVGAPVNPNRSPYDVLDNAYVLSGGGLGHYDTAESSYVRHTVAKLTVSYKSLAKCTQWTVGCTVTPEIEGRKISPIGYRWKHDGSPIEEDQAPIIKESSLVIDLSYSNCVNLPDWLWGYDGTINAENFTLVCGSKFRQTFIKGTLLFNVKSITNKCTFARNDLDDMWDVTLSFLHDQTGFNRFRRMSTLIGTTADLFVDEMVDMLGNTVKNHEEVEWENDFLLDLLVGETS